ncbi:PQQ-binding-like beta-propeller repeat protein [Rhodococcus sp. IEGM 1379]|uniref:outer membrane protein assembly factor BamB family protein n=1 Tax=Rhodococcus sp. IEGM 1379 TaxID=3047086 RepID=UPI0024B7E2A4|nr:PQQ-binding-like beta-propeller repeat protein [Rhodococcus sp. IEGM 1379]MDI9918493.1 PQQ-binding-like beta-propeller repeat protein [Rhodococcus sp. IEGM 1379]
MNGSLRTRILTSGNTTNLTANFIRKFEPSEKFGSVYAIPSTDTVIAMEQGTGDPQYRYTIYDLHSGTERFRFEGDSLIPVGDGLFLTGLGGRSGYVGTQNLLASDGSTIRAVPIPSYSSSQYPSMPSTALPMFLGDGAYDPTSGDELWRSSQLVDTQMAGTSSTIAAIVGNAILVTSPESRTISALDIESGRQLWQTPRQDAYWIRNGVTNGENFVFSDYTGIHSIRAHDGKMMWSVPLPAVVDPRGVAIANAGNNVSFSWKNHFAVWR